MIPPYICVIWGRDRPPTFRTAFQGFRPCSRFLTAKTGSVKFPALCNLKVQNSLSLLSPSTFLAAIALLTVREFSQEQQWLTFEGGGVRAVWWCRMMSFPSWGSHPVVRVVESERASFCAEVTSLARCSFIWDVIVCTLTVSPTRPSVSVRHLSVALCSRDRKLIKGDKLWLEIIHTQRQPSLWHWCLSHGIRSLKS